MLGAIEYRRGPFQNDGSALTCAFGGTSVIWLMPKGPVQWPCGTRCRTVTTVTGILILDWQGNVRGVTVVATQIVLIVTPAWRRDGRSAERIVGVTVCAEARHSRDPQRCPSLRGTVTVVTVTIG